MYVFFAQLEFARPTLLVALLALPLVVIWAWRSNTTGVARIVSALLRCCLVASLVLAAAGPALRGPSAGVSVVALVDRSDRVPEAEVNAALQQLDDDAILVEFDDKDIATAIRTASARIPAENNAALLLISDGHSHSHDAIAAASGAGVPVSVEPLPGFNFAEVCVHSLKATPPVYPAAQVTLTAVISATQELSGNLQLKRNGEVIVNQRLNLQQGRQTLTLEDTPGSVLYSPDARLSYEILLSEFEDKFAANNRFRIALPSPAPPNAMVVGNSSEQFSAALQAAGFQVERQQAGDWEPPGSEARLLSPDLLMLADVSWQQISPDQQDALKKYVAAGGGLILMGGPALFGTDEFAGSTLEEISPVTAATAEAEQKKSTALVLVIDKSKSMLEEDRMSLARTGAKRAIEVLGEQDQLGVLAFSGGADWVAPLGPVTDRNALLAQIDKLQVADRTVMYPAMLRAVLALEQTIADRRHMILLTDGVSTPGDFDGLARRMKRGGIAVSTVSVGAGADQSILKDIARIAGGKHRHSEKASDLTGILVQAAREAASPGPPASFQPIQMRMPQQMSFSEAPPLQKYAATRVRPGAQTLLVSPRGGEPLLAWHRYGKGAVATLAVSVGENGWQNWSGFPAFIQQLASLTARGDYPRLTVTSNWRDEHVQFTVDALTADNQFVSNAEATLQFALENVGAEKTKAAPLTLVAAGRYEVKVPAPRGADRLTATVTFKQPGAGRVAKQITVHRNYPPERELPPVATGTQLLTGIAAVSSGEFNPAPGKLPATSSATRRQPAFMWLLIIALLAFAGDIGVRRLL